MERIDRSGDEPVYQPKIHKKRIEGLYLLKETTGIPMTVLVDVAIEQLLKDGEKTIYRCSNED